MKPTKQDCLKLVREHFGLSMTESLEIFNSPIHPRGMRDELAQAAMQSWLTGHVSHYGHEIYWPPKDIADRAYEIADAMLEHRTKESGNV